MGDWRRKYYSLHSILEEGLRSLANSDFVSKLDEVSSLEPFKILSEDQDNRTVYMKIPYSDLYEDYEKYEGLIHVLNCKTGNYQWIQRDTEVINYFSTKSNND